MPKKNFAISKNKWRLKKTLTYWNLAGCMENEKKTLVGNQNGKLRFVATITHVYSLQVRSQFLVGHFHGSNSHKPLAIVRKCLCKLITNILHGSTLQPRYSLWFFVHITCVLCAIKRAIDYVLAYYIDYWLLSKVYVVWNSELPFWKTNAFLIIELVLVS